MVYAQMFNLANGDYVEAVGDRSVVILDGRAKTRWDEWALDHAKRYGFAAYQIFKGDAFTRAKAVAGKVSLKGRV